jgi:hypothetical protein
MSGWSKISSWFRKERLPQQPKQGKNPVFNNQLLEAAASNNIDLVGELLEKGADVNCQTDDGWTPLLKAAVHGSALTKLLLDKAADPEIATAKGYTPLHRAAGHGNHSVVLELLDAEADVLAKDDFGQNAHRMALLQGMHDMVDLLEFRMHKEAMLAGMPRIFLEGKFRAVFEFAPPSRADYHLVNVTFQDGTDLEKARVYFLSDLEVPQDYVNKKIKVLKILLDQP